MAHFSGEFLAPQGPHSPAPSRQSQSSLLEEEVQKDLDLSEDEGLTPDHPAFAGLFRPTLFKSLLFSKEYGPPGT